MNDDSIELTDAIFGELVDLAGAMREGTIEDIEVVRLDQLLADCPGAVDIYTGLALLTTDLKDAHGFVATPAPPKPIPIVAWLLTAAAAALIVLGLLQSLPEPPPTRGPVVARASAAFDTSFAYGGVDGAVIRSGSAMHAGDYALTGGILELSYDNGAVVIVESPATFTLESDMLLRLSIGNVSAKVPESAIGFTVETEAAKVVDLGTEFAVRATQLSSEVHVFAGEVVVESKHDHSAEPMHLYKDQASRIDTVNGSPVGIDAKPDEFLRVLDEPRHLYPRELKALLPSAYYRMRPSEENILDDFGAGEHNGVYVAGKGKKAMWAPGRYGAALRSEGPGTKRYAHVEAFPLPDNATFSIVAWVKAESRPRQATVVMQQDSASRPLLSLGLRAETGQLAGSLRDEAGKLVWVQGEEPFPLNDWHHIALTSDGMHMRLYLDAVEVANAPVAGIGIASGTTPLVIGARTGQDGSIRRNGTWDGRIDEVGIFHRALTGDDIAKLYAIDPAN